MRPLSALSQLPDSSESHHFEVHGTLVMTHSQSGAAYCEPLGPINEMVNSLISLLILNVELTI